MIDAAALAIATGAAGQVVAHLLQGHVDAVRSRISRIFRRDDGERDTALRVLDDHATGLQEGRLTEPEVAAQWSALLSAVLTSHPAARVEIEELQKAAPPTGGSVNIGVQVNRGAGTIVNGDHHGNITVNSRDEQ